MRRIGYLSRQGMAPFSRNKFQVRQSRANAVPELPADYALASA
jgi:hypothetical protein